jgi:pimeloyl-ACP methyl ester carboxylesterase
VRRWIDSPGRWSGGGIRDSFRDDAQAMLWFAAIAYSSESEIRGDVRLCGARVSGTPLDVRFLQTGHRGSTTISSFILTVGDDDAVIAFRGTDSDEQLLVTGADSQECRPSWLNDEFPGSLHRGFSEAFECIWPDLRDWVGEGGAQRRIWLTGHSLGGALASVAALRLLCELEISCHCVFTFGSPRVFSTTLSQRYTESLAKTLQPSEARHFRVYTRGDPVPGLPPRKVLITALGSFFSQRAFSANTLVSSIVDSAQRMAGDYKHVGLKITSHAAVADALRDMGIKVDLHLREKKLSHHDINAYIEVLEQFWGVHRTLHAHA